MPISVKDRIDNVIARISDNGFYYSEQEIKTRIDEYFKIYGFDHEEKAKIIIQNIQKEYSTIGSMIQASITSEAQSLQLRASEVAATKASIDIELQNAEYVQQKAARIVEISKNIVREAEALYLRTVRQNYLSGMEKTLMEATSSYLSYVVINNPAEVDNPTPGSSNTGDGRSPLKRYKDSIDMLDSRIESSGIVSYAPNTLARELKDFDTGAPVPSTYTRPFYRNDYLNRIGLEEENDYVLPSDTRVYIRSKLQDIFDMLKNVIDDLHRTYGIIEQQSSQVRAQMEYMEEDVISSTITAIVQMIKKMEQEELSLNSQILAARGYVFLAESKIDTTDTKVDSGIFEVRTNQRKAEAKIEDARNFLFSLVRSKLSTSQNYASSVVSAVPEKGQAVINDLKEALNTTEDAINGR